MVKGNGMGTNWRGHYTTDLSDFYGKARTSRARDFSPTVKLTMLVGEYMAQRYDRHYYAKGQNLSRLARAPVRRGAAEYDVLVMPTTAMKALPRPGANASVDRTRRRRAGEPAQHRGFDATGHPAISVPCGLSDGLPIGMMVVGRHFDDATVLRAAHAYEQARGELEAPASRKVLRRFDHRLQGDVALRDRRRQRERAVAGGGVALQHASELDTVPGVGGALVIDLFNAGLKAERGAER